MVACTEEPAIAINSRRLKEFKEPPGWPALSQDGKVLAYRVPGGDREHVVVGEKKGPEFEVVTSPVLSLDGQFVAYGAEEGPIKMLVRGRPMEHDSSLHLLSPKAGRGSPWPKHRTGC